jgi:alpha-L-rhamnosidase
MGIINKTGVTQNTLMTGVFILISLAYACREQTINLAAGKLCKSFSSLEENGWSLNKLTDSEKTAKGWSSKAFSLYSDHSLYPEYVIIDLGTTYAINKISLFPSGEGEMAGEGFPEDFTVCVCREGDPWKVIVRKIGYPLPVHGEVQSFSLKNTSGRYVKIEATRLHASDSGRYYFRLSEIEISGRKITDDTSGIPVNSGRKIIDVLTNLRCENEVNPIGIDIQDPRLSWWIESAERNINQKTYQILVASSEALLKKEEGDMWNSGRIESENSISVRYNGKPLQSGQEYFWKVKVFTDSGKEYEWSDPATFATGKMSHADWKGKWIAANADTRHGAVYLRKEVDIGKRVKRAIVYFCGLGFSEFTIEGEKIGDYFMGPGFTTYNKRTQYLVFDVTKQFSQPGQKGLGVTLADGWYGLRKDPWVHEFEKNIYVDKPKLLLNLHLDFEDGTDSTIVSDESWRWSTGAITYSWIAQEDIDLRKAKPGWDKARYIDKDWNQVTEMRGPAGILVHQKEGLCRIIDEIHPVSMKYDQPTDTYLFDFSSELSGMVRFRTKGTTGTEITITTIPLDKKYSHNNQFILAGGNDYEVYEPRFYNIGIKQLAVKGVTQPPGLEDISVRIISNSWEKSGVFSCSDDFLNCMEDIVRRTSEYYTTFLPNDPTREWKAWTQDIVTMFVPNTYLFDAQRMYERWQLDMVNDQREDGNVPNISPGGFFDAYNSPWWGGCVVWLPWNLYQYYGNESILRESYPAMKRYVDYLSSMTKNGLQDWGLSDWCPIEETPRPIINTPAYYYYATIVSKTAEIIDIEEDFEEYARLANRIKKVFNEQFLDTLTGIYGQLGWKITPGEPSSVLYSRVPHKNWWSGNRVCTQAGQVLPLAVGLAPEKQIPLIVKSLLSEIEAHGNHLSTGFCSTPYLLQILADLAPESGWKMTTIQDYPSWYSNTVGSDNYLMKEMWHGGQAFMPSLAGNIGGWIYQSIGGIRPASPGFKKIIIKPNIVGDLHWVNCSYNSAYGEIESNWQKHEGKLIMNITIPCNTTAIVSFPAKDADSITESGNPAGLVKGVKLLSMENKTALFSVVSGTYQFQSVIP